MKNLCTPQYCDLLRTQENRTRTGFLTVRIYATSHDATQKCIDIDRTLIIQPFVISSGDKISELLKCKGSQKKYMILGKNLGNSETFDSFLFCFNYVIRKTCPCNEYPLKPHFYIVKLGYAGVYLFLFLLQNIDCGYSLEPQK